MLTKTLKKKNTIEIGGVTILPGEQKSIDIPLAAMVTHNNVGMTAHVIHGRRPGPCIFISAAVHGDEIIGVEIIRRVIKLKQINRMRGTIIAIPIVNIHGFLTNSRYLPDGRDLNRSFPGSSKGSLAGRMANTFFQEIVKKCTHGIDLHTGARHRENLPQIRADMSNDEVKRLAIKFGVPAIIDSKTRDGSLRESAGDVDVPVLLYEAGEALRFNEVAIRAGVQGIQNVMRELGMFPKVKEKNTSPPIITANTGWIRASNSGILRVLVPLGAKAVKGSVIGVISDPLGQSEYQITALEEGIIIGKTNLPLVHEGDALFHIAYYNKKADAVFEQVETFQESHESDYLADSSMIDTDRPIQ